MTAWARVTVGDMLRGVLAGDHGAVADRAFVVHLAAQLGDALETPLPADSEFWDDRQRAVWLQQLLAEVGKQRPRVV